MGMSQKQPVDLRELVRLSFAEPENGFRAVQALNLPITARWILLAVAVLAEVGEVLRHRSQSTEGGCSGFCVCP